MLMGRVGVSAGGVLGNGSPSAGPGTLSLHGLLMELLLVSVVEVLSVVLP